MNFKRNHFELIGKEVIGRAMFEPPFKAHSPLENEARFVSVINGNSKLFVPNNTLALQASDSVMMKCDNFVNHWQANENGEWSEVLIVQLYPEVLSYIYDNKIPDMFSVKAKAQPSPVEKIPPNNMLTNYLESLRFYFDNPSYVNDDMIKLKVRELILILVNSDTTGKVKAILGDLFQTNEYDFKEIVHAHLYEDLSVEDLAFFAGVSLSTFKRKFKAVFDTSPNQYIKTKRLNKAQNLLKTTNQRISDIAYDCGFNDVGYFSKLFKAEFNHSPSDFRKVV